MRIDVIMLLVLKWASKTLEERSDDCLYCMYNTNKTLEERSDDCLYCMYNTNKTLEERSDDLFVLYV